MYYKVFILSGVAWAQVLYGYFKRLVCVCVCVCKPLPVWPSGVWEKPQWDTRTDSAWNNSQHRPLCIIRSAYRSSSAVSHTIPHHIIWLFLYAILTLNMSFSLSSSCGILCKWWVQPQFATRLIWKCLAETSDKIQSSIVSFSPLLLFFYKCRISVIRVWTMCYVRKNVLHILILVTSTETHFLTPFTPDK